MFQFDADVPSIDGGTWTQYRQSRFKIAHVSNMKFQRTLARLQQPHRRKIERGELDPALGKDMFCRAMSEGILLDWENVTDKSGEKVPYSAEKGYVALTKDPEFRDFVSDFAVSIANFRQEEIEAAGND
jgi:hypothetical protein